MLFENVAAEDIETVFELYDKGIEFQKTVFDKTWLGFDAEFINKEIDERRLWKITEDRQTACIYSITYADPIIWGKNSGESAMYIHRIVTNPDFRGRAYVRAITVWAKEFARAHDLRFVRMDTWGDNQKLIDYYKDCGFTYLGMMTPELSDELPRHYVGISLSLFEIDLEDHVDKKTL
ncbi:MAG: GNAT family N-acetyltransferase [Pyrinomonadaceae bacterium]